MKIKLGNMTHKQWLAHNEQLRKKQKFDYDCHNGAKIRFIDANNEKKKVYRRASARLISRMSNNLLTKFCGGYIQKAKQRIKIETSVSSVIMQRTKRNGTWKPLNKDFTNLSLQDTQIEFEEIFNAMSFMFPNERIKKDKSLQDLPHGTKVKSSIKSITFQPLGEKPITQYFRTYQPTLRNKIIHGSSIQPNYKKLNDCLKSQTESKHLPNAKNFNTINPNGTLKKFKTINQTKRRFLK